MTVLRFDQSRVAEPTTFPPRRLGLPPEVDFKLLTPSDHILQANPPGAHIHCELEPDGKSRVHIHGDQEHIADICVYAGGGNDITTETIAIASAIYWSWWRARDMEGKAP